MSFQYGKFLLCETETFFYSVFFSSLRFSNFAGCKNILRRALRRYLNKYHFSVYSWIWSCCIAQNMNHKIRKILPWRIGQNFSNCFVHILGNAKSSYIHSEISWPLDQFIWTVKGQSNFWNRVIFSLIPWGLSDLKN